MNKILADVRKRGVARHGRRSQHLLATEPLHANDRLCRLQSCVPLQGRRAAAESKAGLGFPGKMAIYSPESLSWEWGTGISSGYGEAVVLGVTHDTNR